MKMPFVYTTDAHKRNNNMHFTKSHATEGLPIKHISRAACGREGNGSGTEEKGEYTDK